MHPLSKFIVPQFRHDLLQWYDAHKRALPWRDTHNPYHTWLSEIMLQQTTVATVKGYFQKFIDKWPSVQDLANAPLSEIMEAWAGLGYYARARNLHACAQEITRFYNGRFPDDYESLRKLKGVGDYTASAIMAIAFDRPAVVIDGNIDRIIARVFAVEMPLPLGKKDIRAHAEFLMKDQTDRAGDFAQAMMDLGATLCRPKSPLCHACPLQPYCKAYAKGDMESYPRKAVKKPRPERYGLCTIIENEQGEVLIHRRLHEKLLGKINGLPTSEWYDQPVSVPDRIGEISHIFTHFKLYLSVIYKKELKCNIDIGDDYFWHPRADIPTLGMATLFKKAVLMLDNMA